MTHNNLVSFGFSIKSVNDLLIENAGKKSALTAYFHDDKPHADDTLAATMLQSFSHDFGWLPFEFIRTRDPAVLAEGGLLIDVGEGPYDHHGAAYALDPLGIPYCGFSRVWWHLVEVNHLQESRAHQLFYERVVKIVSKLDNGLKLEEGETNLFSWVYSFIPGFGDDTDMDSIFQRIVNAAEPILKAIWDKCVADAKGEEALAAVVEEAQTKYVVDVPVGLDSLWPRALAPTKAVFVIISAPDGTHYVQCVPEAPTEDKPFDAFSKKVALPESWAGKRDKEFAEVCELEDAVFCHIGRFICGFKSHESAELAATEALIYDCADAMINE